MKKKTFDTNYKAPRMILLSDEDEMILCYSTLDDYGDEGGFDDGDF